MNNSADKELLRWQKKLLPFMINTIIVFAAFFFIASLVQLIYLNLEVGDVPEGQLTSTIKYLPENVPEYAIYKSMAILEESALVNRYKQSNSLLLARIWVRYLGFVTGMILALVGSVFILGKLEQKETTLESGEFWKFSLSTSSPGIILAVLGTLLMIITIVTHHPVETIDQAVYLGKVTMQDTQAQSRKTQSAKPKPVSDEMKARIDSLLQKSMKGE